MAKHQTTAQEIAVLLEKTDAKQLPNSCINDGDNFAIIFEYQTGSDEGLIVATRTLDGARKELCSVVNWQKEQQRYQDEMLAYQAEAATQATIEQYDSNTDDSILYGPYSSIYEDETY